MRGRDGPPDKRLFRRARQGDRQAFGLLLRRYDPRLRRLVLRLTAEPERVDPILRRAYVKAWRSLPMVDLPGTVAEWLYRVIYNVCVNELRWAPERPPPPPVQGPRVPMPVASSERRLAGLRALTPEERIPLALVDGEGFSLEATARILQRPPVAVAADLSRARGRWRSFVLGDAPGADAPEVVELDPDEVAEQAEATELGVVDVDPEPPDSQPRHVRVVSPSPSGNGESPPPTPSDATGARLDDAPAPEEVDGSRLDDGVDGSRLDDEPIDGSPAALDTSEPVEESNEEEPVPVPAGVEVVEVVEVIKEVATEAPGKRPRKNGSTSSPTSTSSRAKKTAPTSGEVPAVGAGARRKRRRDAKREVRTRTRGGASKPQGNEPTKPDPGGDSGPRDEPHETS